MQDAANQNLDDLRRRITEHQRSRLPPSPYFWGRYFGLSVHNSAYMQYDFVGYVAPESVAKIEESRTVGVQYRYFYSHSQRMVCLMSQRPSGELTS
jgi:hypothetical protein